MLHFLCKIFSVKQAVTELLYFILFCILSFFCAGQAPPSGGPPDKTPPEITATFPSPGATNFHGNKIRIEFSKYIVPLKVQQSIFLSPNLGTLTYDWGGKDVEIQFSDSLLRTNTTYIFTLGTDVEDTHGNRLAQAFALPFSTGNRIDSASIGGRVVDEKPVGIMIFAYLLNNRLADTLNPSHTPPDYLSQTGNNGSFTLTNLVPGTYRLFAIRDEYKNLLYDRQTDQYGVAAADVDLQTASSAVTGLQFQLTREDTTRPFLSSARALDRSHILCRFSEPMDTASITLRSVSLLDTLSQKPLPLFDVSFLESFLDAEVVTAQQESAHVYEVTAHLAKDQFGNSLNDSLGNFLVEASSLGDSVLPSVKFLNGQDSIRNFDPQDTLLLTFSKPILRMPFERVFTLSDSAHRVVMGTFVWFSSMRAAYVPLQPLSYGAWYKVAMRLDSVIDFADSHGKDTLFIRSFRTISDEVLGSITGMVQDEVQNTQGKIYVDVVDVATTHGKNKQFVLGTAGDFIFEHLSEGKYSVRVFRDNDQDGTYSYGKVSPYRPSERFTIYSDTLKVRARWPYEGVQCVLRRY